MPEIIIHAVEGRSLESKQALLKDITDADWTAIDRNWRAWAGQYQ